MATKVVTLFFPFIHYADYWYYVYEAWIGQYEGIDSIYNLWNGVYVDENGVRHENDVRLMLSQYRAR